MDLYHKPTDTQSCLPFTFSHPNHCKRIIPFCLARRICTIAENNAKKLKNLENLKTTLSKYYYPDSLIKRGLQKLFQYQKKTYQNLKSRQMKASCYSLQHLIQITIIFIVLISHRLIA